MTKRQINLLTLALVLVAVPPLLTRALPGIMTGSNTLTLGIATTTVAAAISLNLLMGYTGQISLGHAALYGIGGFTTAILTERAHVHMVIGVVAAAILTGLVAFILGLPALRLRGLYLAIVTVSFGFMMQYSLFQSARITGGSAGVTLHRPSFFGFRLTNNGDYLALLLVFVLLIWLVDSNVLRSKLGRAFHAIREDEQVAQSFGVDVSRYKLLAFVTSGVMIGVAGALFGHLQAAIFADTFRYDVSLSLLVIVVVGGLGSRIGVTIAAVFFTLIPGFFDWALPTKLEGLDLLIGPFLLMYTMARHPGGLAGALKEAREQREMKEARGRDEVVAAPKLPALPRPATLPPRPEFGGSVLSVDNVTVRFGGLVAVDDAKLEVTKGNIVGLIGPNGAGKTTLFNAISGFVPMESGTIRYFGEPIHQLPPHERVRLGIGRTFQLIGLAMNLSVLENLLLAQHSVAGYGTWEALLHVGRTEGVEKELIERSMEAIEALGFERFTHTPVRNLSHGQKRLVELGCALVTAPDLLMLDEPSAGMAPGAVENLALRLRDVRDELGRTVLLIEHNIPLVLDVCDYLYVLNFGKVLAQGSTEEIAAHPEVIAAYFGEAA